VQAGIQVPRRLLAEDVMLKRRGFVNGPQVAHNLQLDVGVKSAKSE
jgi:hypothetical protein